MCVFEEDRLLEGALRRNITELSRDFGYHWILVSTSGFQKQSFSSLGASVGHRRRAVLLIHRTSYRLHASAHGAEPT